MMSDLELITYEKIFFHLSSPLRSQPQTTVICEIWIRIQQLRFTRSSSSLKLILTWTVTSNDAQVPATALGCEMDPRLI